MHIKESLVVASSLLVAGSAQAGIVTYGPTPYVSEFDSPFVGGSYTYAYLETFEFFGAPAVPGYSISGGIFIGPGPSTDSVDEDDGAIDGSGNGGSSYLAQSPAVSIGFDAMTLGWLPTYVGIVWTDVGNVSAGDFGVTDVSFRAFDAGNNEIALIVGASLGDGSIAGGTAEDRFFGVSSLLGIARIEISTSNSSDWEVDHLQYGLIPAPSAAAVIVLAGVTIRLRRRS